MAFPFERFANQFGLVLRVEAGYDVHGEYPFAGLTCNATGEEVGFIGDLHWDDEATHTVSSSGGKIYWVPSAVTFATAGSTFTVGIQDLSSPGPAQDGSYDVSTALVQGTDTITANAVNTATMSSGSKSITHRQRVAIVMTFTTRNGADSIAPAGYNTGTAGFPYTTHDTGAGPARNGTMPLFLVESDDGHFGFFTPATVIGARGVITINSGTTPDEVGLVFQVPWRCKVSALWMSLSEIDSGETATMRIYSSPLTSPTSMASYSHTGDLFGLTGAIEGGGFFPITEVTLEADTDYCVAYEATSAGSRDVASMTFSAANWRKTQAFGTTMSGVSRTNGSGGTSPAFGSASTTVFPVMGIVITEIENTAGSGPGPHGFAWFD